MIVNNDFNFEVSLSKDAYANKKISDAMIGANCPTNAEIRKEYGFRSNVGVGYIRTTVNPTSLFEALTSGKVMCHLFEPSSTRKDGTFGSHEKKDDNFVGSYVIGVDIDQTNFESMQAFIDVLSIKPTFGYTTYSNGQEGKGVRFRLIYVFDDKVEGKYSFRYAAYKLYNIIENDTKEEIEDKCGMKCSQYFNGTNKENEDLVYSEYYSGIVYSYDDIDCNMDDFIDFLNNYCYYKSKNKKITNDINNILNKFNSTKSNSSLSTSSSTTYYNDCQKNEQSVSEVEEVIEAENSDDAENEDVICTPSFVSDMSRLDYDEFMKYNRHKYNYFYRVDNGEWITVSCGLYSYQYQVIDENYFALYYNVNKVEDKCSRRKKLYQRMCLRRVMNPSVNGDTLLFNAYEDLNRYFDNSGKDGANIITVDELVKNVEWAMNKDIEDIEEDFSDTLAYLRSKAPKKGKIYKFNGKLDIADKNRLIKEVNWKIIGENYDTSISVDENCEYLNSIGISVSSRTLYRFCKENEISTSSVKFDSNLQMMLNYDYSLSLRKNLEILKNLGYKISLGKLSKLVNKFKNNNNSISIQKEEVIQSTTYYNECQKCEHPINEVEDAINFQNIIDYRKYRFDDIMNNLKSESVEDKTLRYALNQLPIQSFYNTSNLFGI